MRNLYLLIRPRFLGFKNTLIRSEAGEKKRKFVMGIVGLAFLAGLFAASCRILLHFQSAEMIGDLLARYLLGMVLLTLFSLLIFSHIITGLSNLYLSKDLELCHSLPVSVEEVFVSRSIYTLLDSSWMLLVFGIPVFLAYGYVYRAGPWFYLTLVHINLAMALIAAGLGILLTMALVYLFPARRTKDVVMLLSVLLIMGLFLLFRFLRPERLVNPEAFFSVMHYVSTLKGTDSPYLPTHWIAEVLWGQLLAGGRGSSQWFFATLTWSTAGALVVINTWLARGIYYRGYSKSQQAKKRKMQGGGILESMIRGLTPMLGEEQRALIAKDIRTFFRDNTQWSQLLLLGALIVVYLYNFTVLPLDKSPIRVDFLQNELAFFNMGLAGFVLSAVSARFVFTSVSSEGEAYWLVRSSPLSTWRFLWAKYLLFILPMLVLVEALIILTNYLLEVSDLMMILSSLTMGFMSFGIVALAVGLGAAYPRFRYENISQVATGFGGVVYMIMSTLFIGVVIVLEAGPVYILFMADMHERPISLLQLAFIIGSFAAVLVVNVIAIYKPMKMGLRALEAYE